MGSNGREEREFEGYVDPRWRHLVHAAILLGCSPPEAGVDAVERALGQLSPG